MKNRYILLLLLLVIGFGIPLRSVKATFCPTATTGDITTGGNCTFSATVDGPETGDLIVNSGTLTIGDGQIILWNSGKSVKLTGGDIAFVGTAQMVRGDICLVDADGDGYPASLTASKGPCSGNYKTRRSLSHPTVADCNDNSNDPSNPTLTCYPDADSDGFYATTGSGYCSPTCPAGTSATVGNDCNDASYSATNTCCTVGTYYRDADGDGYGAGSSSQICPTSGWVADNTDCDDSNASIWRTVTGYLDADNDGYGAGLYTTCTGNPGNFVASNGDCNDSSIEYSPGNSGWYSDSNDHNCSGSIEQQYGGFNCTNCTTGTGHAGKYQETDGTTNTSCGGVGTYYTSLHWGCYEGTTCPSQSQGSVTQGCH